MLRRLSLGFFALACCAVVAACSSGNTTPSSGGVPGIGPNFAAGTLYVTNPAQSDIEIFPPQPSPSASPSYAIGGANTSLNGPQYDAFDSNDRLYVTSYNAGSRTGLLTIYEKYATGNVLPFGQLTQASSQITQPRGVALLSNDRVVIANENPASPFISQLLIFNQLSSTASTIPSVVGGSATHLNEPWGVAVDANDHVFVADNGVDPSVGTAAVTEYALPTPAPAPSGSPTAAPTASPTASASGSPSPSPTATPYSLDLAPIAEIGGSNTGLVSPTGIALDTAGNIYVADPDNGRTPAILIFKSGSNGNVAPMARITSSALIDPTDVKVDANGIYVVDAGNGPGTSKLLTFALNANGSSTPTSQIAAANGTLMGLALSR